MKIIDISENNRDLSSALISKDKALNPKGISTGII